MKKLVGLCIIGIALIAASTTTAFAKRVDTIRMMLKVDAPKTTGFSINGTHDAVYSIDWGDGGEIQTITLASADFATEAVRRITHNYTASGLYKVKVWSGEYGKGYDQTDYTETISGTNFKMDMVYVTGGRFTMGGEGETTHQVSLDGYYIGRFEITQAQWMAVMGENPSYHQGGNLPAGISVSDSFPVENITWAQAKAFCEKLSAKTGKKYTLPTEAQWEFAARGGTRSGNYTYSGSGEVGNVAWYDNNSDSKTHKVGTKAPNELGIYDMSGNVSEWCADWYSDYGSADAENPTGPATGTERVYRGGSWFYDASNCRVSKRQRGSTSTNSSDIGFRVIMLDSVPRITKIKLDNGCTSMDASGLLYLDYLDCADNAMSSLNISGCAHLQVLTTAAPVDTIKASGCKALKDIMFHTVPKYLDLSGCAKIPSLAWKKKQLAYLNVSACTDLTYLDCSENQLVYLNASGCAKLESLFCYSNQLTSLQVNGCEELQELSCYANQLTSLDASGLTELQNLRVYSNRLTNLKVDGCAKLESLFCYANQLTSLDVSTCAALTKLDCHANRLASLDMSGNSESLEYLDCKDNQLTSLNVSSNIWLRNLYCGNNKLTSLDVRSCVSLNTFNCAGNQLTSLDISKNKILVDFDCSNNQLTELNLNLNTKKREKLKELNCHTNRLTRLDVTNCVALEKLWCYGNKLTSLDVSQNNLLNTLQCRRNELKNLVVSGNTTLQNLSCEDNHIPLSVLYPIALKPRTQDGTYLFSPQSDIINLSGGGVLDVSKEMNLAEGVTTNKTFSNFDGSAAAEGAYEEKDGKYCFLKKGDYMLELTSEAQKTGLVFKWTIKVESDAHAIAVQSADENMGTVGISGNSPYAENTNVTIRATAKRTYRFVVWKKSDGTVFSRSADTTFVVREALTLTAFFELTPSHTVALNVNNPEWGEVSGGGVYREDSTVVIVATAKTGCYFMEWKKGDAVFSQMREHAFRTTEDLTLTAVFGLIPEDAIHIKVKSDTARGKALISGDGIYAPNAKVTITAEPNEWYRFTNWKKDGGDLFGTERVMTFEATEDLTLIAGFQNLPPHTIRVWPNNPEWGSVRGGGDKFPDFAEVVIEAIPKPGCRFVRWIDTIENEVFATEATYTFKATQHLGLKAIFEPIPNYTIAVRANNPEWGSVSGGGTFQENTTITIRAKDDKDHDFIFWKNGDAVFTAKKDTTFKVTTDLDLVACFDSLSNIPEPVKYTITLEANNPAWGNVSGGGVYFQDSNVTIIAMPRSGYRFVHWKSGDAVFATRQDTTFKASRNLSLTAYFEAIPIPPPTYTITLRPNNAAWGSVSSGGTFQENTEVTIMARPKEGYRFVDWRRDDEVFGTVADTTFRATMNLNLVAYFEEIPIEIFTVSVRSNDTTLGKVSISGNGTYEKGEVVTITAKPTAKGVFVRWLKDGKVFSILQECTLDVTGNMEFLAYFEEVREDEMQIYTAPGGRSICLSKPLKASETVQVFNVKGSLIYQGTDECIPVPVHGVYIVRIGKNTYSVLAIP